MSDIKIVIKLSEEDYTEICKCAYPNNLLVGELVYQVRNNKPLPKGHGRLIDADELKKVINQFDYYDQVSDAPTIIEAYKAESEDKE